MIELTLPDGSPVSFNPMAIWYVQQADDGAAIASVNGHCVEVREAYDEVVKRVREWTRG